MTISNRLQFTSLLQVLTVIIYSWDDDAEWSAPPALTLTVYRVTGFQAELSERVRRRRRTRLTLRSPGSGHRTTAVGFRHGSISCDAGRVTAVTVVVDAPAVQQMSVAESDPRILIMQQNPNVILVFTELTMRGNVVRRPPQYCNRSVVQVPRVQVRKIL